MTNLAMEMTNQATTNRLQIRNQTTNLEMTNLAMETINLEMEMTNRLQIRNQTTNLEMINLITEEMIDRITETTNQAMTRQNLTMATILE
jgi:hypothetical protein